jgi:hypothetical protein
MTTRPSIGARGTIVRPAMMAMSEAVTKKRSWMKWSVVPSTARAKPARRSRPGKAPPVGFGGGAVGLARVSGTSLRGDMSQSGDPAWSPHMQSEVAMPKVKIHLP